eukprot:TRINITY_DN1538_c0_g1_i1.p1 TRINITY_DN1538_c0_g1~~TRINITY_DN1538_c0_g1_i1.p1  ORF type:complete len:1104 (+),score=200.96 TRINITY_DN1538_c0_g1_i1:56-3367(+)
MSAPQPTTLRKGASILGLFKSEASVTLFTPEHSPDTHSSPPSDSSSHTANKLTRTKSNTSNTSDPSTLPSPSPLSSHGNSHTDGISPSLTGKATRGDRASPSFSFIPGSSSSSTPPTTNSSASTNSTTTTSTTTSTANSGSTLSSSSPFSSAMQRSSPPNAQISATTPQISPCVSAQSPGFVLVDKIQHSLVQISRALAILGWPALATTAHSAWHQAIRHVRKDGDALAEICLEITEQIHAQELHQQQHQHQHQHHGRRQSHHPYIPEIAKSSGSRVVLFSQSNRSPSLLAQERMTRACHSFSNHLGAFLVIMRPAKRRSYLRKLHMAVFHLDQGQKVSKPDLPKANVFEIHLARLKLGGALVEILAAALLLIRPASKAEKDLYSATNKVHVSSGNGAHFMTQQSEMHHDGTRTEMDDDEDAVLAELRACAPEIRNATIKLIESINYTVGLLDQRYQSMQTDFDQAESVSTLFYRTTELLWGSLRDLTGDAIDFGGEFEDQPLSAAQMAFVRSFTSITRAIGQAFGDKMDDVFPMYGIKDVQNLDEAGRLHSSSMTSRQDLEQPQKRVNSKTHSIAEELGGSPTDSLPITSVRDSDSDSDDEMLSNDRSAAASDSDAQTSVGTPNSETLSLPSTPEAFVGSHKSLARLSQSLKRRSALLVTDLLPKMSSTKDLLNPQYSASTFDEELITPNIPDDIVDETDYWGEPSTDQYILYYIRKTSQGDESRCIFSATLNKLVSRLSDDANPDTDFERVFFTTYPSFATSFKVLEKLKQRFNVPPPPAALHYSDEEWAKEMEIPNRSAVMKSIEAWVTHYSGHISTKALIELELFMQDVIRGFPLHKQHAEKISSIIKSKMSHPSPWATHTDPSWLKLFANRHYKASLPSADQLAMPVTFEPEEIAKQITLIDWKVYNAIKAHELLQITWGDPRHPFKCPNVVLLTQRFNQISAWVAACVVSGKTVRERVRIVSRFVKIAENLREMNNFNALFAVTSGLLCSAVHRLKYTNQELNKHTRKSLCTLHQLMRWDNSFRNYRRLMDRITPPVVPYLGRFYWIHGRIIHPAITARCFALFLCIMIWFCHLNLSFLVSVHNSCIALYLLFSCLV